MYHLEKPVVIAIVHYRVAHKYSQFELYSYAPCTQITLSVDG